MFDGTRGSRELKGERDVEKRGQGRDRSEDNVLHKAERDNVGVEVGVDDLLERSEELLFVGMKEFSGGGWGVRSRTDGD